MNYIIAVDPAGIGQTGIIIYHVLQNKIINNITFYSKNEEEAINKLRSRVDTSDFTPRKGYQIKDFDSSKYIYKIWVFYYSRIFYLHTFKNFNTMISLFTPNNQEIIINPNGYISMLENFIGVLLKEKK